MYELSNDPSTEHLRYSAVTYFRCSLAAQDQPPAPQLVAAQGAKGCNGTPSGVFRRVAYGHAEEIVVALGAFSRRILRHTATLMSLTRA